MQQATNKGAFTVINTAAGQHAQKFFLLMLLEVFINVGGDQF
jgi:hypothetical protein